MHGNIRNDLQKFDKVIVCSDNSKLLQALSRETEDSRILFLPVQKVPDVFEKKTARNDLEDI